MKQEKGQIKSKVSKRKEIVWIIFNGTEKKKSTEKINETKSWFFEKI